MTSRPILDQLAADPQRALAEIAAERSRRNAEKAGRWSFAEFVHNAWPLIPGAQPLQWNPYLSGVALALEALARRRIKRLIGNGPPRNGKSNLFAILWPAWVWTWNPAEQFVYLSFDDKLVRKHSIQCRDVVSSKWYRDTFRPTWELKGDRNTQSDFETTAGGGRLAASMKGSGLTGRGGNIIAIDDPLSAEEAVSETERKEAVRILDQVVTTRLNDPATGVAAMLMQRVHYYDPSEWAQRQGWKSMVCPLEYDSKRPCSLIDDAGNLVWEDDRSEGEVLAPTRYPADVVRALKANVILYQTQYQQAPILGALAGKYFKGDKIAVLDEAPAESEIAARVRSWDLAATEGGGDWTVGVLLARLHSGRFVILDVKRRQLGPHGVRKLVEDTAKEDGPDVTITLPQDPGQAGKDQGLDYVSRLAGYTVKLRRPDRKKELRAGPASSQVMGGNVAMVRAAWNAVVVGYLEAFPTEGVPDDDVDALSDAMAELALEPESTMDQWGGAGDVTERDGWAEWT